MLYSSSSVIIIISISVLILTQLIYHHYDHLHHSLSSLGDLKRSLLGHTERINCVTAKKDNNNNDNDVNDDALIMSCTISGSIRIWNYATG